MKTILNNKSFKISTFVMLLICSVIMLGAGCSKDNKAKKKSSKVPVKILYKKKPLVESDYQANNEMGYILRYLKTVASGASKEEIKKYFEKKTLKYHDAVAVNTKDGRTSLDREIKYIKSFDFTKEMKAMVMTHAKGINVIVNATTKDGHSISIETLIKKDGNSWKITGY